MRPDLTRVTITQLEELTGQDRRRIKESLTKGGVAAVETTKRERWFPARASLEAIYQAGDDLDLTGERARLAKEQADAQALRNAELRGELVRGDEVEAFLIRLLSAVVQRIRAIPAKAAPEVRATGSDAEGEALLGGFHDEALTEIADSWRRAADWVGSLRKRAIGSSGRSGGSGDATAAAGDGERVGGPGAEALPGEQRGAGSVEDGKG